MRLTAALVTVLLLAGCRAPARPQAGVPAGSNPVPVVANPMIGLDGSTLQAGTAGMIGNDGSTITAMNTPKKPASSPSTRPSAGPSAGPSATPDDEPVIPVPDGCDELRAHADWSAFKSGDTSVELTMRQPGVVTWAASAGEVTTAGDRVVWTLPPVGTTARLVGTVDGIPGSLVVTVQPAAVGRRVSGPSFTGCGATP